MQDYLTPDELAKRWGVSKYTLLSWRKKGKGPKYFLVGKLVRYRVKDIEKIEENKR